MKYRYICDLKQRPDRRGFITKVVDAWSKTWGWPWEAEVKKDQEAVCYKCTKCTLQMYVLLLNYM